MLGAGRLSLSTAGGGGNAATLNYFTYNQNSYVTNANNPVPVAGLTGDLIFLFTQSSTAATGMTGWNQIYNDTIIANGNTTYFRAYWKVKTSSDTTFSDTWPNFEQLVYRPSGGTVTNVTITNLLRAQYTTGTPPSQTLTMPTSGRYVGIALFSTQSNYWLTKTSSVTPTRTVGNASYTSVMTFENLTGNTPFANSTIGGTVDATTIPSVFRSVYGATITLV